MNINPMQIIQLMKSGQNPQQMIMQMLSQQAQNNPIAANLFQMAQQGRSADIEAFARNYFASQGKDFDKEFNAFRQTYGL